MMMVIGLIVCLVVGIAGYVMYMRQKIANMPPPNAEEEALIGTLLEALDMVSSRPVPEAVAILKQQFPGMQVVNAGPKDNVKKAPATAVWYKVKNGRIISLASSGQGVSK